MAGSCGDTRGLSSGAQLRCAPRLQHMGAGEGPCCHLRELQEGVHRLCSIRDGKQEIDWSFSKTLQVPEPEPLAASTEGEAECMLVALENGDCCDGEGWKLVTSGTRRMAAAPSTDLQLQKGVSALVAEERLGAVSMKPLSWQHKMVKFRILRKKSKARSRITTLDFRRADFGLCRDLL